MALIQGKTIGTIIIKMNILTFYTICIGNCKIVSYYSFTLRTRYLDDTINTPSVAKKYVISLA